MTAHSEKEVYDIFEPISDALICNKPCLAMSELVRARSTMCAALADTVHSDTRKLLIHIAASCALAHHDDALSPSDSEFIRTAAIRIRGIADKYRKALEAK